jgi:pimeloyl-ACP methyl ester carboxylesterase
LADSLCPRQCPDDAAMLNIVTAGAGAPPLFLIHGWACDHRAMVPVAAVFAAQHRCVSVDLLGHGQSPKADDYGIKAQAAACLAVMPEGAIVVGHSMGGQIAAQMAADAPDKVAGIVLLDPAPIISFDKAIASAQALLAGLEATQNHREYMDKFARAGFLSADLADVEQTAKVMRETDRAVAIAACRAFAQFDGAAQIAAITCPGLMIVIDKAMNRPADMSRANKNIMTAQVAGSGHCLQFDVMDQVAAMMRRFMGLHGWADMR